MNRMLTRSFLLLTPLGILSVPPAAHAARLLNIRIERDGQLLLSGITQDDGKTAPEDAWRLLEGVTLRPEGGLAADAVDPLGATLTGTIRIAIYHGVTPEGTDGIFISENVVQDLHLTRSFPQDEGWRLAPGELARTAPPPAMADVPPWDADRWILAMIGIVAALATIATAARAFKRVHDDERKDVV